jgi:tetratricopeptide (TPR) repeat protein
VRSHIVRPGLIEGGSMRRILIGLAFVLVALPAWAQTQEQIDWCSSPTATDDQTIAGCTAMIQSGRYSGSDLSNAYNDRADGHIGKSEWDMVVQDATQAIQIDPTNAEAFNNRGVAYRHKNLYDQAIADYTRAIALKPDYAHAYNNRGYAYEMKNQRDRAISDYRTALKLDPNYDHPREGLTRLGVAP